MLDRLKPKPLVLHVAFWSVVFLLNVGPEWHRYLSAREVFDVAGTITGLQALVALIALRYLVPRWLERGRIKVFAVLMLCLLFLAAELNILISYAYLEPAYPNSYGNYYRVLNELSLLERLGFSRVIKWIVFSKLPLLSFPAAVLIAVSFYQKQQSVLALREQKKAAELEALKNQLNPHFIFNTLNNIYALAIKQSDQTPEAIAKLSGILDYVLYRCNDQYVSLAKEVAMINDYIALEQLRFGDRLNVSFDHQAQDNVQVAPLLFLTLIENAFKHGASHQLDQAIVNIALRTTDRQVEFEVSNTKPECAGASSSGSTTIGLANLRRQLDLLYPDAHKLDIVETSDCYTAHLSLERLR
ncbi:MAG: histidine kinase [Congregibacter sp.]